MWFQTILMQCIVVSNCDYINSKASHSPGIQTHDMSQLLDNLFIICLKALSKLPPTFNSKMEIGFIFMPQNNSPKYLVTQTFKNRYHEI